jgi:hypothetical protein
MAKLTPSAHLPTPASHTAIRRAIRAQVVISHCEKIIWFIPRKLSGLSPASQTAARKLSGLSYQLTTCLLLILPTLYFTVILTRYSPSYQPSIDCHFDSLYTVFERAMAGTRTSPPASLPAMPDIAYIPLSAAAASVTAPTSQGIFQPIAVQEKMESSSTFRAAVLYLTVWDVL